MSGHESARKRVKISKSGGKSTSTVVASASSASASTHAAGCQHEQSLRALHSDMDAMRQLVTCKICDRLLYEPYALSCGHTYCYSCLTQWFSSNRHKKTCPDCRAVIVQEPTPSYIIKELVLIFVSRSELLPDGETAEEHGKWVKDEAVLVARDKENIAPVEGGLFKGMFKRGGRHLREPIVDRADNVTRCPYCNWELEDGFCNGCEEVVDPSVFSDFDDSSDLSDSELDHEIIADDVEPAFGADVEDFGADPEDFFPEAALTFDDRPPWNHPVEGRRGHRTNGALHLEERGGTGHRRLGSARRPINLWSSDGEEEPDEEGDEHLNGFVVNDDEVAYLSSDDGEEVNAPVSPPSRPSRRRRAQVVISDDEDDVPSVTPRLELDQESDEDELPVRGSQRNKRTRVAVRQRRARTASSDEQSADETDGTERDVRDVGGFSPPDSVADDAITTRSDYSSVHNDYESDGATSMQPHFDPYGDDVDTDESDDEESASLFGVSPPPVASRLPLGGDPRSHGYTGMFGGRTPSNVSGMSNTANASTGGPGRSRTGRSRAVYRDPTYSRTDAYSENSRPRPSARNLPRANNNGVSHPFQLASTLANINGTYNQRNQQSRSNPTPRTVSAGSSQGGGVELESSGSSGSSATVRPGATSDRRKRNLSIHSDDDVEEVRRVYAY